MLYFMKKSGTKAIIEAIEIVFNSSEFEENRDRIYDSFLSMRRQEQEFVQEDWAKSLFSILDITYSAMDGDMANKSGNANTWVTCSVLADPPHTWSFHWEENTDPWRFVIFNIRGDQAYCIYNDGETAATSTPPHQGAVPIP